MAVEIAIRYYPTQLVSSMRFTDIHCHLLPGIDDGAKNWDDTLEMAAMALADGTETIICTPHQLGSYSHRTGDEIRTLVSQTQKVLDEHQIPLLILPGADVRIDSDMIDRLRSGDCVSLGDHRRHVLLELPHEMYMPLEPVLNQLRGIKMLGILSHPERNQGILRQPELLAPLVSSGCLMQITAESLLGVFGEQPQRLTEWMLLRGLVHFVASDGHSPRRRKPLMSQAKMRVADLVGEEVAVAICCNNPANVAAGRNIAHLPAARAQKKSWFSRLLSRSVA